MLSAILICACACTIPPDGYSTVTFYVDGAHYYSINSKRGESLEAPAVAKQEGYVFKGWYRTEEYIEKWDFESDVVNGYLFLYAYWVPEGEETFNILFYNDDKLLSYQKIPKGETASECQLVEKKGYEFLGWYDRDEEFDFSSPINADINLIANYQPINYTVTFIADNEIVGTAFYNIENKKITVPEIPPKEYYSAKWADFTLKSGDIEVEAIYSPIEYTATFIADGKTVNRIKYTVEDDVKIPKVPEKSGYTGEWIGLPISGGDITLNAEYSPIVYSVTYMVDNKIYEVSEYTVEDIENFVNPPVPIKEGYTGSWEKKSLGFGDVTINAIYKIKIYTATFVTEGTIVGTVNFRYDEMNVKGNEPNIPQKTGYAARWKPYTLQYEDITIEAEYIPINYTANYYIKGEQVGSVLFTVEDTAFKDIGIYEWNGYSVSWEEVLIVAHNVEINAILTPITYYVTFVADEKVVAKVEYNVEDTEITVPPPPKKEKFTVKWEEFVLTSGNITVQAVYTPLSDEELNFKDEFTYDSADDGSLIITGYAGKEKYLYVPAEHAGKAIKAIGKLAFSNSEITGIKISEGIEIIDDEAFLCCVNLTEIILPESLSTIGKRAFGLCTFTSVNLPDGITFIDEEAFTYSAVESIVLPKNLTELSNCFRFCDKLKSITLNTKLTELKAKIFEGCSSLKNITIPANIKLIDANAFYETALECARFEDLENWKIYSAGDVELTNVDYSLLADEETAARWLTKIYVARIWKNAKE